MIVVAEALYVPGFAIDSHLTVDTPSRDTAHPGEVVIVVLSEANVAGTWSPWGTRTLKHQIGTISVHRADLDLVFLQVTGERMQLS